jgi:hypothetical protein
VEAWAERGLSRDEKMLYAADAEHPSIENLVAGLATRGLDAAGAAEEGQLVVVDAALLLRRRVRGAGEGGPAPGPPRGP